MTGSIKRTDNISSKAVPEDKEKVTTLETQTYGLLLEKIEYDDDPESMEPRLECLRIGLKNDPEFQGRGVYRYVVTAGQPGIKGLPEFEYGPQPSNNSTTSWSYGYANSFQCLKARDKFFKSELHEWFFEGEANGGEYVKRNTLEDGRILETNYRCEYHRHWRDEAGQLHKAGMHDHYSERTYVLFDDGQPRHIDYLFVDLKNGNKITFKTDGDTHVIEGSLKEEKLTEAEINRYRNQGRNNFDEVNHWFQNGGDKSLQREFSPIKGEKSGALIHPQSLKENVEAITKNYAPAQPANTSSGYDVAFDDIQNGLSSGKSRSLSTSHRAGV